MSLEFECTRVFLRPLADSDAQGLHLCYSDPEVMQFWDLAPSVDVLQTATRIGRSLSVGRDWHLAWAVLRREDGQFMGMVNYHHREPWNRRLELGWILARPFWRQGYMKEAVAAVLRHCFTTLDAHRIEATIAPENAASRALAASLGFQLEGGPMRDRMVCGGVFRSAMMYGLLRPDWERHPPG